MKFNNENGEKFDVVVVGGGPTGLVTALTLLRSGLKVQVIEKHDKTTQSLYGRACVIFARTLELLDQLGTSDELIEIGFTIRAATTLRDGKEVPSRGWKWIQPILEKSTFFDYSLCIRQKYSEDVFRRSIESVSPGAVETLTALVDYTISSDHSEYPISAIVESGGKKRTILAKYIVGADGARSVIREKENIQFDATPSPQRWIRMDAIVESNIPNARSGHSLAFESPTHGNVLWLPLDHGTTRIGYALSKDLSDAYDAGTPITAETAIEEAKKAVAPYNLEVKKLEWYTAYTIAQRVAETYRQGNVLLAGDAVHTHSSGAAQGMNTGVHDAVNLGWKLGGFVRGWYKEAVLDTYSTERRAIAQRLIAIDKDMSSLIGGKIPQRLLSKASATGVDPNDLLIELFGENAEFTVGVGISYEENVLNRPFDVEVLGKVKTGERAPDVILCAPSGRKPRRLYEVTPNDGRLNILVFAGHSSSIPRSSLAHLKEHINRSDLLRHPALRYLTIVGGSTNQIIELLGTEPFGRAYVDTESVAYSKYGISPEKGALVVLRPDAHLASAFELDGLHGLEAYLRTILVPSEVPQMEGLSLASKSEKNTSAQDRDLGEDIAL